MNGDPIIRVEEPSPLQRRCRMDCEECRGTVRSVVLGKSDCFGNESTGSTALCDVHLRELRDKIRRALDG